MSYACSYGETGTGSHSVYRNYQFIFGMQQVGEYKKSELDKNKSVELFSKMSKIAVLLFVCKRDKSSELCETWLSGHSTVDTKSKK